MASTRPVSDLLDRDLSKAATSEARTLIAPLLQDLINYGSAALARCSIRPEGGEENLVILLAYRHLLEMTDGVEILVAEAAAPPAALQLRSAFEGLLSLEYMTKEDAERRGLAYLATCFVRLRSLYGKLDPSTADGRELHDHAVGECHPEIAVRLSGIDSLAVSRADVEARLALPGWKEAHDEFQATKKRLGRRPEWYALYGGPTNLRNLAGHLKRRVEYELLYSTWSQTVHAVDLIAQVRKIDQRRAMMRRLRYPADLVTVADFAMNFLLDGTKRLLEYYRPAEIMQWSKWQIENVFPRRQEINARFGH